MATAPRPLVPAIATADAALVAIAERRAALKSSRKRFLDTPDPDALHDLRVDLRRLRAALALFAPDVDLPRRVGDRRLRRLGHGLAPLRDADIVRAAVTSDEAAAAGISTDLVGDVDSERDAALRGARRTLRRRRTRRLLRALARWERAPRFTVTRDVLVGDMLPARLREQVEAFAEHPAWGLKLRRDVAGRLEDATGELDGEGVQNTLHALRRRAKKVRYALEIAGPLLGVYERSAVEHLKAIQDALGELQDVRVIEAALAGFPPVERPERGFEEWLRDRRYRALEQWRRLRRDKGKPVLALLPAAGLPSAD